MRTRIFVDFWNLQLSIIETLGNAYRLDWKKLSPLLVSEAENLLSASLRFDGTNVYLSYNARSSPGRKLHGWSQNTLDHFPGIKVIAKERRTKRPPTCPHCYTEISNCPHCAGQMVGTVEKGIDTGIVTDMMKLAWESAWDVAILVSSDRDFIPTVEYLDSRGLRVINVYFPPKGEHLARTCWAAIGLQIHLPALSR